MKIVIVAGARPNFMKISPIINGLKKINREKKYFEYTLVHTGQHYDKIMSDVFFNELGIQKPDINLDCGGGSQAEQTAKIMISFEKFLLKNPTDLVIVVGDVTSTMSCSIVAQKLHVKVAHVEAGIRSGDWKMPEEINRLVTDSITNYFFTTTKNASENLINSGIETENIFFVGNTMIDTLLNNMNRLRKPKFFDEYSLSSKNYFVMTIHRPSNVDDFNNFNELLKVINDTCKHRIILPVHPRIKNAVNSIKEKYTNIIFIDPLGYLEFNYLVSNSLAVITDSGGITEETTVMGIPCLTLRENTERPETCEIGTNELVGTNLDNIRKAIENINDNRFKKGSIPDLWDGKTGDRIANILINLKKNI